MKLWSACKALIGRNTPVYAHYGITHRCNLTCAMCGLWKLGNKSEELNVEQIRQAAANLGRLGTLAISLGGGEPFVREDLPEIVKAFMDQGIETRVLTNGLAGSADLKKKVADTGLRHISISLDTPHPEIQSEICHKPEIWRSIIEQIRFWSPIVSKRGGTGLINCVVSARNLDDIKKMTLIAEETGFFISLVPLERHSYQEQKLECPEDSESLRLERERDWRRLEELREFLRQYRRRAGSALFNSEPYIEGMIDFLKCGCADPQSCSELEKQWKCGDCGAGALSLSISPSGHASMCHFHNDSAGSAPLISSPEFPDWYRYSRSRSKAAELRQGCRRCFRPCWWEISLSLSTLKGMQNALRLRMPHSVPDPLPAVSEIEQKLKEGSVKD